MLIFYFRFAWLQADKSSIDYEIFLILGDALSSILMPHWAAAINTNKEKILFRTMVITIRVIALLSVKYVSMILKRHVFYCFRFRHNGSKNLNSSCSAIYMESFTSI
jgi:hypothetical protein